MYNYTDVRAKVEVNAGDYIVPNNTLKTKSASALQSGDNVVYNETIKEVHIVFNGKNKSRSHIELVGSRCIGPCLPTINETEVESEYRRWSNASVWPSGKVPVAGEDVEIKSGWNMLYDVAESPIIDMLEINGRLTFEPEKDLHLRAKYIFVRAGELIIGNKTNPFTAKAIITLHGEKDN
jgi:hypothetical protein